MEDPEEGGWPRSQWRSTQGTCPSPDPAEKWMQWVAKKQAAMLKQLGEQQRELMTQVLKAPEKQGTRILKETVVKLEVAMMTGPSPIRLQKMGTMDDPEAFLYTFK